MTDALDGAFGALGRSGARGLPSRSEVLGNKKTGATWTGKQRNGDPWKLIKNSDDSYNIMCN